jgi:hypothetical protein
MIVRVVVVLSPTLPILDFRVMFGLPVIQPKPHFSSLMWFLGAGAESQKGLQQIGNFVTFMTA